LARGHIAALKKLQTNAGLVTYNLGTGKGCSVLEMIKTFEKANELKLPFKFAPRRAGDAAVCYADPKKAEKELGFKTQKTLEDMCRDSWLWQKNCI